MHLIRILSAAILTVGTLLIAEAPANAASGPWARVSSGSAHTCAINTAGSLYCWGGNAYGQTGDGTVTTPRLGLHRVGAAGVWRSVSAGGTHTCGITKSANLYCWGENLNGQTGTAEPTPTQLSLFRVGATGVWNSVTTGELHTCGITTAKNLYCWGRDDDAQTGDGDADPSETLHRVGAAGVWNSATAGNYHTCGITTASNLYCWGDDEYGQIGKGSAGGDQLALFRVGAAGVWTSVAGGGYFTCGITKSKNLYCWGENNEGQTGDGTQTTPRLTLHRVGGAGVWNSVNAGYYHTCGITTANNLYCWGYNPYGQTGDGTTATPRLSLFRVAAAGVWASVSAGGNHTCGMTTANNLYCWGYNTQGQTGDGTTSSPRLTLFRVL